MRQSRTPVDAELFGKHENYQPVGAFKVASTTSRSSRTTNASATRSTASTGNRGQSIAYGASRFGVRGRLSVLANLRPPEPADQSVVDGMTRLVVLGVPINAAATLVARKSASAAKEHSLVYGLHRAGEPKARAARFLGGWTSDVAHKRPVEAKKARIRTAGSAS